MKSERQPRNWNAQFEWKLQDMWVGAFWKRTGGSTDLWICFVPCVPLHISWWHHKDPKEDQMSDFFKEPRP